MLSVGRVVVPVESGRGCARAGKHEAMTTALLSATDETDLAIRIDVGVFAQHLVDARLSVADATVAELHLLAAQGRQAREDLLLANLRLLGHIARAEAARFGAGADEVFQEGFFGLVRAVERFDPARGRFGPWAAWWIRASIRSVCFDRRGSIREMRRRAIVRRTAESLTQQRGSHVSAGAVAEVLSLPVATVERHLSCSHADLDDVQFPDESPVRQLSRMLTRMDLLGALERLPRLEAVVLATRFGGADAPVSVAGTASRLGLDVRTVRRLEARGLARLRAGLGQEWAAAG